MYSWCTKWHSTLCSVDRQRSYHVQWTDANYSRIANKTGFYIITASSPAYNYDPNIDRVARSIALTYSLGYGAVVNCITSSHPPSHWWPVSSRTADIGKKLQIQGMESNRFNGQEEERGFRATLRCVEGHGMLPSSGEGGCIHGNYWRNRFR
ncbi:uncharacterized protein EURHEDRAFT_298754 [Aspergillus ruber CBS 135680]|uniref:Uncharacterized protein n=1 Tax=Aspergillus ruber (strain CBS 135680) TaxID=1388766 RepID=A0A017SLT4_ASPRC|nr:uncharacterized protein EURHEDRAFT_298754 [Aspergillus ruber CBS 135680]EYE97559.1 hypothetical protein EURHEDRAFT_298754 [Aspergillus ruber CBS 135680]